MDSMLAAPALSWLAVDCSCSGVTAILGIRVASLGSVMDVAMTGTRHEANKHRGPKDRPLWYPWRPSDSTGRADLPSTPPRVPAGRAVGEAAHRAAADAADARADLDHSDALPGRRQPGDGRLRVRLPQPHVPLHRGRDADDDADVLVRHALVAEARRPQARGRGGAPLRQVPARAGGRAGGGGRAAARCADPPLPGAGAPVDAAGQAPERVGAPPGPPRLPAR